VADVVVLVLLEEERAAEQHREHAAAPDDAQEGASPVGRAHAVVQDARRDEEAAEGRHDRRSRGQVEAVRERAADRAHDGADDPAHGERGSRPSCEEHRDDRGDHEVAEDEQHARDRHRARDREAEAHVEEEVPQAHLHALALGSAG
jgi:hypothetical protein